MAKSLKIIFAGTPAFAAVALLKLLTSHHDVIAVYTQPDKPAGRGLQLKESEVKVVANAHQLPLYQPKTLRTHEAQNEMSALTADLLVVAAYGLILPKEILAIPRYGCINIHPSLLPRWRGAAPIQRTIFYGDKITGVTMMQMDEGLDTGPVILQRQYTLKENETSQSLHDEMAKLGAKALIAALDLYAEENVTLTPQDNEKATYAHKITKEEAAIDWTKSANEIENLIRAFNPWPVAFTSFQGESLRIWSGKAISSDHQVEPGTVIAANKNGVDISTGSGALRLLAVQLPGKKIMKIADFYNAKYELLKVGKKI